MSTSRTGFLITAAFIGPGTITTASLAGAEFGLNLLWGVWLATAIAFYLQDMAARVGMTTGQGLAENLRFNISKKFWRPVLMPVLALLLVVSSSLYQAGNIAGTSQGVYLMSGYDHSSVYFLVALIAILLPLIGSFSHFEQGLTFIVVLMVLLFGMTLIYAVTVPAPVVAYKPIEADSSNSILIYLSALIGTTVVPYNLFFHSSLNASSSNSHIPLQSRIRFMRMDYLLSIGVGGLITAVILTTAALTLHGRVTVLNFTALQQQLSLLLGAFGNICFAIGIIAAGLSSALIAPFASAVAVCELMGWSSGVKDKPVRWILALICLLGLWINSIQVKPILLIVFVQAGNALLLPLIVLFLVLALNHKKIQKSWFEIMLGGVVFLLTVAMGVMQWLKIIAS